MSNAELALKIEASPHSRDRLRRERQSRLTVRAVQLLLLLVMLVLWEVLPRAQLINPLFTSYPSAIWPPFLELLHGTPQQAGILAHTAAKVFATVVGFLAATAIGTAVAAALWGGQGLP